MLDMSVDFMTQIRGVTNRQTDERMTRTASAALCNAVVRNKWKKSGRRTKKTT